MFTLCEKLFGRRVSYGHPPSHVCLVSLVLCLIQLCCNCGCGGRVGQGEDRHSPPLVNPLIDERQPYPSPGYVSICMRFLPPSIPTIITWITLSIHDPVCQWTTTSSWGKMIGPLWWAPLSQYILCSPNWPFQKLIFMKQRLHAHMTWQPSCLTMQLMDCNKTRILIPC